MYNVHIDLSNTYRIKLTNLSRINFIHLNILHCKINLDKHSWIDQRQRTCHLSSNRNLFHHLKTLFSIKRELASIRNYSQSSLKVQN